MFLIRIGILLCFVYPLFSQTKSNIPCQSLSDCLAKSELTSIHRKKISYLSFGLSEFAKDASVESLLPLYLIRARSTLLEANGETGYKGEIVLKVSHKPEYKLTQFQKAESDIAFIEANLSKCSSRQVNDFKEIKELLNNSK